MSRLTPMLFTREPTAKSSSMSFPPPDTTACCLTATRRKSGLSPASARNRRTKAAALYRGTNPRGPEVCLVLGAGNLGTITALDIIDQLYIRGNVCAVKMNPVNEYLGPFYEHIFKEFISRGWLRLLYGGADVGGYLAQHPKVDTIHMTRSAATYDAIVWGIDDQ